MLAERRQHIGKLGYRKVLGNTEPERLPLRRADEELLQPAIGVEDAARKIAQRIAFGGRRHAMRVAE